MTDYMKRFSLKGKRAVVAGGAGLIGRECVRALAQAGAAVVIAETDEKKAKTLAAQLAKARLRAEACRFDIADIENLEKGMDGLIGRLGRLDIWVNTAYPKTADWGARAEDVSHMSWRRNVDMHLNGYALSSKYACERMKSKGGSVINFGSTYGIVGSDFTVYEGTPLTSPMAYAAIKGGIVNLDRYLASYFGRYNIRVNTLCPGGVFDNQDPVFVKNYSRKTPLKRMASSSDIAPVVVFLASDAASYITGATIMVDGGWTAV